MSEAREQAPPRRSTYRSVRAALLALLLTAGILQAPSRVGPGNLLPVASIRASQGYWLVAADGGVFAFGDARYLGPNRNQGADIIGMARTPDGNGLWTVDDDGDVFHTGSAINYGSRLVDTNDIRGFAARPQGDGYWMVTKNGAVFSYGRAAFYGPHVPLNLNKLIVGMAATPSGNGYWFVARDGGIFTYGDARFYGSTGAITLNQPIVGMAPTLSGNGYWLVASDGGIFSFGDARFFGSTGAMALNQPIVGMALTGTGNGYWLVASDGGIFSFGDAAFHGSTGGTALNQPIVGMVPTRIIRSNDFPSAVPDSVNTDEDNSVSINVLANDVGLVDGPITVSVVEGPGHGVATVGGDRRITYTPDANYFGPDALTYAATDVDGDRSITTVAITVVSRNDLPAAPDQAFFTPEEAPVVGFVVATDADGDALTYTVTSPPLHGSASVDGVGFFTYTPAADYNGNDSFTITVSDGRGGTDTAKIGVAVGSLNDPPVATDKAVTTPEETPVTGAIVATDPEGDTFTYSVSTAPAHGAASIDATGTFTYTPALNYAGPDSFVVTVDDGHGGTDTAAVSVTVTGSNDGPTISAIGPVLTDEDNPVTVSFTIGDAETLPESLVVGATSSNQLVVASSGISLGGSGASRNVTLSPVANASGSTTITVTVSDGAATTPQSFELTVGAVNDSPTITAIADRLTNEGTPVTVTFTVADAETSAGSLTLGATSSNETVVASSGVSTGGSGGSRSVSLDPVTNGSTTITVTVSDGTASTSESFVLTVNAVPVASDQSLSVNVDSSLPGSVNALDADGDALTYSVSTNGVNGNAIVGVDGSFIYTPDIAYVGSDSFTITVSDGRGGFDTAVISVVVVAI